MSGRRSIGRRTNEITPSSAIARNSMAIDTGRSVEKRGSDIAQRTMSAHRPAHRGLEVEQRVDEAVARLDLLPAGLRFVRHGLLEPVEGARAQPVLLAGE